MVEKAANLGERVADLEAQVAALTVTVNELQSGIVVSAIEPSAKKKKAEVLVL